MNERIKEFRFKAAEYANEQKPFGLMKWNEIRDAKFAELIVRECAEVADDGFASSNFGNGITGHQLLKHFGVEE